MLKRAALLLLTLSACKDESAGPPVPAAVSMDSLSQAVQPGESVRMTARVFDKGGRELSGQGIIWSSADNAIATVDASGTVTAHSDGSTTIAARAGNFSAQRAIEVGFRYTDVATLYTTSCATTAEGKLYCWGRDNAIIRLPAGRDSVYSTPRLSAAPTPLHSIRGGTFWICGLNPEGRPFCGGSAAYTPSGWNVIPGASGLVSLSVGYEHGCGLDRDKQAFCWGSNFWSELGRNLTFSDIDFSLTVREVASNVRFDAVMAGPSFSCAVGTDGKSYCWGATNGTIFWDWPPSPVPVVTSLSLRFEKLYGAYEMLCGLTGEGEAYCWGINQHGRLGIGPSADTVTAPTRVATSVRFSELALGTYSACGLAVDGRVYCWGNNLDGVLGDGTTLDRNAPVAVQTDLRFRRVSVNRLTPHACAITTLSLAYCWGSGELGQLGDGQMQSSMTPVRVLSPAR